IHNLRGTTADGLAVPDTQLLERFADAGDEAAFELVARRHGPMVLGVCRRVLGDTHEAEDAFQATLLLLARKADTLTRHPSVGAWLHPVAFRVAQRARARRAARTAREQPLDSCPAATAPDPASEAAWRDVRRVIDEEVSRLPEKYRVPFVLYHLEGYSAIEVARELACPISTAESWLVRARGRLRARLARRGLTPATGLLVALAPREEWLAQATAREALAVAAAERGVTGAVSAEAAALAGEVVQSLGAARARTAVVVLLLAAAATGAAGLAAREHPRARPEAPAARSDEARPGERAGAAGPVKRVTLRGGHFSDINALALSPDGLTLASAGDDAAVKLWDVAAGRIRATLRRAAPPQFPEEQLWAHEWQVQAVAFSPDGKTLASGSNDRTVKLWDVATSREK